MRVHGLKSPGHHFGWLMGLFCFGLAILYPALPRGLFLSGYPGSGSPLADWSYLFVNSILASGGIVWHIISYLHWQTFVLNPWTARTLFAEFAPFCFVPIVLPLCVWLFWSRLVTHSIRTPTTWRGVESVLLALVCAGVLIYLLDQIGGRVLLHIMYVTLTANLEIRGLMEIIWRISVGQLVLLAFPLLALGGGLARYQQLHETRPRSRQPIPAAISQHIFQDEKASGSAHV